MPNPEELEPPVPVSEPLSAEISVMFDNGEHSRSVEYAPEFVSEVEPSRTPRTERSEIANGLAALIETFAYIMGRLASRIDTRLIDEQPAIRKGESKISPLFVWV
jgi:hypothetical protein